MSISTINISKTKKKKKKIKKAKVQTQARAGLIHLEYDSSSSIGSVNSISSISPNGTKQFHKNEEKVLLDPDFDRNNITFVVEEEKKSQIVTSPRRKPLRIEHLQFAEKKEEQKKRRRIKKKSPPIIKMEDVETTIDTNPERRTEIRNVWDTLTEKHKQKKENKEGKYGHFNRIYGTYSNDEFLNSTEKEDDFDYEDLEDDFGLKNVISKEHIYELALEEIQEHPEDSKPVFLGRSGFQRLDQDIKIETSVENRSIDPKHQRSKRDVVCCLNLLKRQPGNQKLESDLVSNLEMLEIFDPFLATKLKFHHPELVDIKLRVYEREKEPVEWSVYQVYKFLEKEGYSFYVIDKFKKNNVNGITLNYLTKRENIEEMANQLDLDEEICHGISAQIRQITWYRRKRNRRVRRSPAIVNLIRKTLPNLTQKKVLFYAEYLATKNIWQIKDLCDNKIWDKLDEIKTSHLIELTREACKLVEKADGKDLKFQLKQLIKEKANDDNVSVATGLSMSPSMLTARRLLAEQWCATEFPEVWDKYPERGGKYGYVLNELVNDGHITKKQKDALNVLRYHGAIGSHFSPLSQYQSGQIGRLKKISDKALGALRLLKQDKTINEEKLILQSHSAMNTLGLVDEKNTTENDNDDADSLKGETSDGEENSSVFQRKENISGRKKNVKFAKKDDVVLI